MNLSDFQKKVHENAINKGFWHCSATGGNITAQKLCLIHSEVSEAMEVVRQHHVKDVKVEFGEELADIIIRVLDLAEYHKIDLLPIIIGKHSINKKREFRHNKRF